MSQVWIERRKWPDRPHYGHAGWLLGRDESGWWIDLPEGTPVFRGEELRFHLATDGVMLVPDGQGWLAWFLSSGPNELYVDIVTPPVWSGAAVTMVDLDLDVVRKRDGGGVELLDEDEFEEHQRTLGYPDDLVRSAAAVASAVLDAIARGEEPFAGVAAAAWADSLSR